MDNQINSRLDLEIYLMGEMKYEFLSFLGECYKDNFFESLSWGNFRRFQLILNNKSNWINIHFILLKNESNADVLINSFKIYEKRNMTLLLYNVHDQKSEKNIEPVYNALIFERNKFYDGILDEESVEKSLLRLSEINKKKVTSDDIKSSLKFLTEKDDNLIFKIGFYPNVINKKTKNIKKIDNSNNTSYLIENEIFYMDDEEPISFTGLLIYLLQKNFRKLMFQNGTEEKFIKVVVDCNKKEEKVSNKSKDDNMLSHFVKIIDYLIIVYILSCAYKFNMTDNS
jgi:hypothetical protein